MSIKYIILFILFVLLAKQSDAQNVVFAELSGDPLVETEGWNLTGNASVGNTNGTPDNNNNEIILTDNENNQSGGIFWEEAIDLNICSKWTAEFDFRIFDGNGADGLAFCFLDVPPDGFVAGGGVGIPAGSNGLKIIFDTYDNCGGPNPQIQIYSGVGYNECIAGIIALENTTGNLNFIRRNDYNSAVINYDEGQVTVSVNGNEYLTGFAPANFTGFMGFTASTGGLNDRHSIKNAVIYTGQAESNAGPDIEICSGEEITIGVPNNPDYVYSWEPTSGLSDPTISNPQITITNEGTTPITEEFVVETSLAENPGVCPTTDTVLVTIKPNPLALFEIPEEACTGEEVVVNFTGEEVDNTVFDWDIENGTFDTTQDPSTVTWEESGNFTITLTLDADGCQDDFTSEITVHPVTGSTEEMIVCDEYSWNDDVLTNSGTYTFETTNVFGCDSVAVLLLTVNESKETFLSDEVCDSLIAPNGDILTVSGEYTYIYEATNGCDSTVYLDAVIYPTPDVSFSADPEEGFAVQEVTFTNNSSESSTNFWDFGDGMTAMDNNENVNHTYVEPGEYLVRLEGVNGICSDDYEMTITILLPDVTFDVPNVFTPNNDGVNDFFKLKDIIGEDNIERFEIAIVNRWGNTIRTFNTLDFEWNGTTSNGELCTEGTYFYRISLQRKDLEEFVYNGFVQLVRD